MSAPVLSGDLRAIPLPDILLLLNTNHKSGTLRCLGAGATKTVDWEKGDIVFARSTEQGREDQSSGGIETNDECVLVQTDPVERAGRRGKVGRERLSDENRVPGRWRP